MFVKNNKNNEVFINKTKCTRVQIDKIKDIETIGATKVPIMVQQSLNFNSTISKELRKSNELSFVSH